MHHLTTLDHTGIRPLLLMLVPGPSGADLSQYAVSCQALLDDDRVTELAADATVQFLLKAGYEHVARRVGSTTPVGGSDLN